MLVGNKIDMCERNPNSRRVSTQQGKQFAENNEMLFQETSAVTVVGVKEAFEDLLQEIFNVKGRSTRRVRSSLESTAGRLLIPKFDIRKQIGCCNDQ